MATAADSGVVSSDIVGYQNVDLANGYSLFTATFKGIGNVTTFDLTDMTPKTPAGVNITGNGKVLVYVLDTAGNYGTPYAWYGSLGGWSTDGATTIPANTVTLGDGVGVAVYNSLKVLATTGAESTARQAVSTNAVFQVSGAVELTPANATVSGYSLSGNNTPVAIDLAEITPVTTNGVAITGNGKVLVYLLDTAGNYGTPYAWYGAQSGWSTDNGTSVVPSKTVMLSPGQGFAVYNSLKVLPTTGAESTARQAVASPAVLNLPPPVTTSGGQD